MGSPDPLSDTYGEKNGIHQMRPRSIEPGGSVIKLIAMLFAVLFSFISVFLCAAVTFGVLQHINAPTWMWVCFWIYMPLGAIAQAIIAAIRK